MLIECKDNKGLLEVLLSSMANEGAIVQAEEASGNAIFAISKLTVGYPLIPNPMIAPKR